MNKQAEIKTTKELVKDVLTNDKKARSSDSYLYFAICAKLGKERGIDVNSMSMPSFFAHLNEYGFPSYDTVGRCRRRLQAADESLAADPDVEAQRSLNEDAFIEYAKGNI